MARKEKHGKATQKTRRARMEKFLMSLGLPPLLEQIVGKKYELEISNERLEIQAGFVKNVRVEWACGEFHIYIKISKFFEHDRDFIERSEGDHHNGLWEVRPDKYGKFRLI